MITLRVRALATDEAGRKRSVEVELDVCEQGVGDDGHIYLYGAGDAWRCAIKSDGVFGTPTPNESNGEGT